MSKLTPGDFLSKEIWGSWRDVQRFPYRRIYTESELGLGIWHACQVGVERVFRVGMLNYRLGPGVFYDSRVNLQKILRGLAGTPLL